MKKFSLLTRILFFVFIAALPVLWIFAPSLFSEYEDKNAFEYPMPAAGHLQEYPQQLEAYYNENLPFKTPLLQARSYLQLGFFGEVNSDKILYGKEGWLYFYNDLDGTAKSDYKRLDLYTQYELNKIADNLQKAKQKAEAKGAEFVLFLAPNKEQVYPEYMPSDILFKNEQTKIDQLVSYLKENTDITVVYPKDELLDAKQTRNVYYCLDSHWNEYGGYIGYTKLMQELELDYAEDVSFENIKFRGGDLAIMLKLEGVLHEQNKLEKSGLPDVEVTAEKNSENNVATYKGGVNDKKLFIMYDSFFNNMSSYVTKTFGEVNACHIENYIAGIQDSYDADVIVYETVERYLDRLLTLEL